MFGCTLGLAIVLSIFLGDFLRNPLPTSASTSASVWSSPANSVRPAKKMLAGRKDGVFRAATFARPCPFPCETATGLPHPAGLPRRSGLFMVRRLQRKSTLADFSQKLPRCGNWSALNIPVIPIVEIRSSSGLRSLGDCGLRNSRSFLRAGRRLESTSTSTRVINHREPTRSHVNRPPVADTILTPFHLGVCSVSWLKRKLDVLGKRKDAERRLPQQVSLSQVEQLESRLCLGSLNAPHVGDWTPDDPNDPLEPIEVSTEQTLSGTTQMEPDDTAVPPTLESPNTGTAPTGQTPTGPMTSASPTSTSLDVGLEANQTQIQWDETGDETNGANTPSDGPIEFLGPPVEVDDTESMGVVSNTGQGSAGEAGPDGGSTEDIDTSNLTSNSYVGNLSGFGETQEVHLPPWWQGLEGPVTIKYDFRDVGEFQNYISDEQKALVEDALATWSEASGGMVQFVQDTDAADHEIMNIGTGELEAFGHASGQGGKLGLGGGAVSREETGEIIVAGTAWLDVTENWDETIGNGDPAETVDFHTVVGHEIGHVLGFNDSFVYHTGETSIMQGYYDAERGDDSYANAVREGTMYTGIIDQASEEASYDMRAMTMTQLSADEVTRLLSRASAATASDDAVIAVVDRGGTILGVHVEDGVIRNIDDPNNQELARAFGGTGNGNGIIDTDVERRALAFFGEGAVAKARTAAFFSNGDPTNISEESPLGTRAPLTSRLVRFISQTTITQREVESVSALNANPNYRGPGFVAPIGLGGHFPPEVRHTPPVDLFAIEHTNRDRVAGNVTVQTPTNFGAAFDNTVVPPFLGITNDRFVQNPNPNGPNILRPVNPNQNPNAAIGANDVLRFNIPQEFVGMNMQDALREPLSFGEISGLDPNARSRGIATLPGGIPIFRDVAAGPGNIDKGVGDTLIGGIGVFFPGRDGFATFEQGFKPGVEQAEFERTNAPKVLEAEFMALVAIGGSLGAARVGIPGASVKGANDPFAGTNLAAIPNIDLPFGRLDLVGITLQVIGPEASRQGVGEVIVRGFQNLGGQVSGSQVYAPNIAGREVPFGYIVPPRDAADGSLTAAQVDQIIQNAIRGANEVRAAVRLPVSSRTRMVFAVSDNDGNILGLFRMQDATVFSIDVAVAKARNTTYYANAAELDPRDQVPSIPAGTAFTNRTFRFLAEPRFPSGVDGDPAGPFSTLNNPFIDPFTGRNTGTPAADTEYLDTVLGRNAFNPTAPGVTANRNFLDPDDLNNQNGVVFFPGSTPLYFNGRLVGGFGVSGDGVDQDDVVTFIGAQGFLPQQNGVVRSDQTHFRDVRLPYQKFLRNPFG